MKPRPQKVSLTDLTEVTPHSKIMIKASVARFGSVEWVTSPKRGRLTASKGQMPSQHRYGLSNNGDLRVIN